MLFGRCLVSNSLAVFPVAGPPTDVEVRCREREDANSSPPNLIIQWRPPKETNGRISYFQVGESDELVFFLSPFVV